LIAKLARAVAHAHERGILHRDLKPGNVLFDGTDKPFVSDFGLAKWLERECDLTQTLAILGTPHYMAPEQTAAPHSITPAADIYSLGAILFHLLTGRVPFRGENALDVLRQAAEHAAPRPRTLNRKVPADLETICLKCLEKKPAARYSSATALADDLDRFLARRTILARRAKPLTHAVRWVLRNPSIAGLGAASALLLVSLLLVLRPAPAQKTEAREAQKSIAVLPFENLSEDKTNEYFADGIHDEVLVNLSRLGDLKVVSRNSVLPYKGTPRNLREIGKALGVKTVLEGNVRRAGDHTRINVQLIDVTNDQQIWAESFEPETANLFSAQSDLALRIATALETKISPAEKALIETPPTRDETAYNLYLHARELEYSASSRPDDYENDSKRIEYLKQAIARDPHFALAYSYLGRLHLNSVWKREDKSGELLERARACVEKALQIAPDLGEAHLAQGIYFADGLHDYRRALTEFAIARRASPNSPECLSWSGLTELHLGRWKEGLQYQLKAASLDPFDTQIRRDLIETHYDLRDYAAAERAIERAIIAVPLQANFFLMKRADVELMKGDLAAARATLGALPPDFESNGYVSYLHTWLALLSRDYPEAERWLNHIAEKFGPERTEWWVARDKAFLARAEGNPSKAQAALQEALRVWKTHLRKRPEDPEAATMVAIFDAGLGHKEEAISRMQKVLELHPVSGNAMDGPELVKYQALVYAWCGERDRALEQLATLENLPAGPSFGDLKFSPKWDDLRGDARFEKIVAAFGDPIKIE
jgi:serine/threonine-protein kinase